MKRWIIIGTLLCASTIRGVETDVRTDPVVQAVQKALPTVVNISTDIVVQYRDPFADFWEEFYGRDPSATPRQREHHSLGSGVILDPAGYIITNAHVVARATRIHVVLADGTKYEGKLLAADARHDLALMKISAPKPLPHIELAREADLFLGETVIAVGNPFGLGSTVTKGILSAKNRKLQTQQGAQFEDILQTDAAVNPGNSGGALIDINAKLLGITTAIKSPTGSNVGIGFAVPAWRVETLLAKWLRSETRGVWFGANLRQEGHSVVVAKVEADSPAAKAGLVSGDRIAEVDGVKVTTLLGLHRLLLSKNEGDKVKLGFAHADMMKQTSVQLAKPPTPPKLDGNQLAWQKLGLRLRETEEGLVVNEVDADGPAATVERGLFLMRCDGARVRSLDQLAEKLAPTESGDRIALTVARVTRRGNLIAQQMSEVVISIR